MINEETPSNDERLNDDMPEEGMLSPQADLDPEGVEDEDALKETDEAESENSAETGESESETEDTGIPPVEESQDTPYRMEFPKGPNQHSEITKPVFSKATEKKELDATNSLSFMNMSLNDFNLAAENYPHEDYAKGSNGAKWRESLLDAQGNYLLGNALQGALDREDSVWRQAVTAGAEQLQPHKPRFGDPGEGSHRLSGEQAIMRLRAKMGLGMIVRVPLWHTGIWVTLKAPSEKALLELDRRIGNEKVTMGRLSNGLIFSSTSVYIKSYLVNFALAHIYEATVKYTKVDDLKSMILTTDIPTLIWGLLCTIYPQGYPYRQPCAADPSKCQHVVEELIAINKLLFTDDRALTEKQRQHMTYRNKKYSKSDIELYQAEHGYQSGRTLTLSDDLVIELRVSTVGEYEQSGISWVDGIVHDIDQSFGGTLSGADRNEYIIERAQVTALRQYAHYVNKITMNNGQDVIDDKETIADALAEISNDDTIFAKFFDGVGKFIDSSTISMIALPRVDCPACGKDMTPDETKHPYLVPLDIENLFFTLVGQRINKALSRLPQ